MHELDRSGQFLTSFTFTLQEQESRLEARKVKAGSES